MKPSFQKEISIPVRNHLTGESYELVRIDQVEATGKVLKRITSICSESKIYAWLFRDLFDNKPYTESNAVDFFEMGNTGWKENTTFTFILLSSDGEIAAAIDIKSPDLDEAEIGYWASETHRGCMTNTTIALLLLAQNSGYKKLFARTKKENKESANVLLRAGFSFDVQSSGSDEAYNFYRIDLLKVSD